MAERITEKEIREQVAKAKVYQPRKEDGTLEREDLPDLFRVDGEEFGWTVDVHAENETEARKSALTVLLTRNGIKE